MGATNDDAVLDDVVTALDAQRDPDAVFAELRSRVLALLEAESPEAD